MDYFGKRFGGNLFFQPQMFLDMFIDLGYVSMDQMCKWRDERRNLLNLVLAYNAPEERFFDLLSHHAMIVRTLDEVFPTHKTNAHRMLLEEFTLIIPLLTMQYFQGIQWSPNAEYYIFNFVDLHCVSNLKRVLEEIGESVDRIQNEVRMLIRFQKGFLESKRCKNINILQVLWQELKLQGKGSLVYSLMYNMLPKEDASYHGIQQAIHAHMRRFQFI